MRALSIKFELKIALKFYTYSSLAAIYIFFIFMKCIHSGTCVCVYEKLAAYQ